MIDAVEQRLGERQLVVVHGSSGCGKSSLVKAGILPRLEQEHHLHGMAWRTAQMRPGSSPLWNLAEALARVALDIDDDNVPDLSTTRAIRRHLDHGERALTRIAEKYQFAERGNVCLLLDQFEELFRYAREIGHEEADTLIEVLRAFERKPLQGIYALVTMRSDHLGDCAQFAGFAELVNETQYLLPRMDEPSLIRAIREPARLFGGDIDMQLTLRLVEESRRESDALPLVQHCLMRLWQQAGGGSTMGGPSHAHTAREPHPRLSAEGYPGLQQTLSTHADEVLSDLAAASGDQDMERSVEYLFRALTEIDADGRGIRRPTRLSNLAGLSGDDPQVLDTIIAKFSHSDCGFLMRSGEHDPVIDISHEALIRCWKRMTNRQIDKATGRPKGWLQREQEDSRLWRALLVQAEGGEHIGPAQVDVRQEWFNALPGPIWAERYDNGWGKVRDLIYESREARDAQIWADEAARIKDARLRKVLTAASIAFLFLAGISVYFWIQAAQSARDARESAAKASLAVESEKLAKEQAEQRERAAEVAKREAQIATNKAVTANESALRALKQVWRYAGRSATNSLSYPEQLSQILIALEFLPDVDSPRPSRKEFPLVPSVGRDLIERMAQPTFLVAALTQHTSAITAVTYSADDSLLASASADETVIVWDAATGSPLHRFSEHKGGAHSLAFHPQGLWLAIGANDNNVRIFDTRTGELRIELSGHRDNVHGIAWSPDGSTLATTSKDDTLRLWNSGNGNALHTLKAHAADTWQVAFDPLGRHLASVSSDGSAIVWRVQDGTVIATLEPEGRKDPMYTVSWSSDGKLIATGSKAGVVSVWDAHTYTQLVQLDHGSVLHAVSFSPDSRWLATATADGLMRIWVSDADDQKNWQKMPNAMRRHTGSVRNVAWSSDGRLLATGSDQGALYVYRVQANSDGLGRDGRAGRPQHSYSTTFPERVQRAVADARALVPRCLSETERANLILPQSPPYWCERLGKPPFHVQGWVDRGIELLKEQQFDAARERFRKAKRLESEDRRNALRATIRQRSIEVLTEQANKPLNMNWEDMVGAARVDKLKDAVRENERTALTFLREALKLDPEFGATFARTRHKFHLDAGAAALRLEDSEQAALHFEQVLRIDPKSLDQIILTRAETAQKMGQSDLAALLALELVLADDESNLYPNSKTRSQALEVLNLAVEMRPTISFKHAGQLDAVAFSPDARIIATGASDNMVVLWDAHSAEELKRLEGHSGRIPRLRFSADGRFLASSSFDDTARVWDLEAGTFIELTGHESDLWGLDWSPRRSLIATGGFDKTIRLWQPSSGASLGELRGHTHRVWDVAFSPNGAHLISGSSDGSARIWDIDAKQTTVTLHSQAVGERIYSVDWSPQGDRVATGSNRGHAKIWDAQSGALIHTLGHGKSRVWSVRFSPDGQWLATGSTDGVARIFDVATGEEVEVLRDNKSGPDGIAWTQDGRRLVTGTNDGTARVWEWTPNLASAATDRALQMLGQCLSADERTVIGLPTLQPHWCRALTRQAQAQSAD